MSHSRALSAVITIGCLVALCGCATTAEIRVKNISTYDFTDLSIAGQPYGDLAASETSDSRSVKLRFSYAAMKLWVNGRYVTGQTLNMDRTGSPIRSTSKISPNVTCASRSFVTE